MPTKQCLNLILTAQLQQVEEYVKLLNVTVL